MSKTLIDILNSRNTERQFDAPDELDLEQEPVEYAEPSEKIDIAEVLEMEQKADAEETARLVRNMKRYEKEAAVRGIPTDILQNEISRRMNRDHKALVDVRNILGALDEY